MPKVRPNQTSNRYVLVGEIDALENIGSRDGPSIEEKLGDFTRCVKERGYNVLYSQDDDCTRKVPRIIAIEEPEFKGTTNSEIEPLGTSDIQKLLRVRDLDGIYSAVYPLRKN